MIPNKTPWAGEIEALSARIAALEALSAHAAANCFECGTPLVGPLCPACNPSSPAPVEGLETTAEERKHWSQQLTGKPHGVVVGLLDRLLRDFDRVSASLAALRQELDEAERRAERGDEQVANMAFDAIEALRRADAAEASLAALTAKVVGVLEPFAVRAQLYEGYSDPCFATANSITIGALRAARALVRELKGEGNG